MVDTRKVVPNEESRFPFLYCPSKGWMLECLQDNHNTGDGSTQNRYYNGYYNGWAPPPVSTLCLPDVITHDQISQAFPRRIYIFILEAIKYWQWEWPGNEESITDIKERHCALWASNVPFVVWCLKAKCALCPLLLLHVSNHLRYLTRQGFTGLPNDMNLIMHHICVLE